ncbi:MAG: MFS transporter [Rhodocyclaceae bacterium]|nr:MFS transporter [Rhodocyclaceae bacterium]
MKQVEVQSPRSDARVIAVIGFAHGVSHFFHLLLPPLFPWLMADFGLSYIEVGATMTVFFTVSAIGQAAAGFAVDRFGALRILYFGMACFALAAGTLASAESATWLYLAAALAGIGNSVFHPADFTVLNRKVTSTRLGHAFSVHGVSGNLGWALAPAFVAGIASLYGWRIAAFATLGVALGALLLLWSNRRALQDGASVRQSPTEQLGAFAFLNVGAIWLCFAFFFCITAAFGAIQNFAVPVLQGLYQLSLGMASATLSVYLLAATAGVIAGGFLVQRNSCDQVVAVTLSIAALLIAAVASSVVPAQLVLPMMAAVGFFTGTATPSRDLLVRRVATARFGQAAYGRIYGFVYAGLDTGFASSPLVFGGLMNDGRLSWVLIGIAILQGLAIVTALSVGSSRAEPVQAA